ncbi:MAG: FtsQ-type POTRA domain-containing protein [Actinobacteria bacterium]|nr:FtsQ-type POTRA domain-containing protein [Actinomycetota bacterium]
MSEKVLKLPRRRGLDVLRFAPSGRSFAIGVSVVLVAAGLYALARETSMFAVRSIEIHGASPALAAEIRSELAALDGRSLVSLDASSVGQRVDGLPAVRSAVVDRAFPHTVRIHIVPELPVAVLRRGAESWLVSARSRVIGTIERGGRADLPRIWLPSRTELTKGSLLADEPGVLAARSVAAFVGSGFPSRVAFVRALDGQITLGLRGGLEIQLGAPVDLRLKIAIARGILPTLALPRAGGPDYLDITVPERPVAGRNPQLSG